MSDWTAAFISAFRKLLRQQPKRTAHVTDAMNRVCAQVDTKPDPLVATAGRRALERSEW